MAWEFVAAQAGEQGHVAIVSVGRSRVRIESQRGYDAFVDALDVVISR